MNEFFEMNSSPDKYNEVYDKYLVLSHEEIKAVSMPKSRLYFSVADMDIIQEALELLATEGVGHGRKFNKRRVMQMGYSLEEIKQKLIRRTEKEKN